ncbi:leucine--tRNA ligase, mitochondrial-like [Ylistrum balloti]|uniref:leucine--tRNA ligase, mitochondrial-like n=1 Tax=Ylistrum balloti TaxID=509963 RepID=UPI002905AAA7|nr:leucine--tRNA ligase, mitochondrial-like [Ylistrum balloti]XP_060080651.1 leucine--tRNA ligase, mitochondrial-like [Ylistrum balloti]
MVTWCILKTLRVSFRQLGWQQIRHVFSETGQLEAKFDRDVSRKLEEYWKPRLKEQHTKKCNNSEANKEKYYVLSMFPYPSGQLHMGHVRVYTISDVMARFHRLCGKQVIHPMGWDAFGLPAENAAIERGLDPQLWTTMNIASMKKQMDDLFCSFDWDSELNTSHPSYYKWTQFIFLKMYEHGLVYQNEGEVNWDPVDKTVLADEQIDENGRSWRSGAKAEKRFLRQWYIKTTAYTKDLIEGLDEVDTSLWRDIVRIQKEWLGECNGCRFNFELRNEDEKFADPMIVFTHSPELVYGISHIALSPSHRLNNAEYYMNPEDGDKKNFDLKIKAIHPFTGKAVPVVVSHTTKFDENSDVHLAIPDISEADCLTATELDIPVPSVLTSDGQKETVDNSAQFSGMSREEALKEITAYARERHIGGHMCSSKLNDWLISRQRYWGTPIPLIKCPNCKIVPVPMKDLPVELPSLPGTTEKGRPPLAQVSDWYNVKCPKCGGPATRETDTMDTFVDSSWYFFRYLDPKNTIAPFDKDKADRSMPVNLYIGGKEHAVLHLFFARFFSHFLYNCGYVSTREPFINLLTQGMVLGESYSVDGRYISKADVDFSGPAPVEKSTGLKVFSQWEKMSKSKYNGVDPQEIIDKYGVDATRLCILSNVAPKSDRKWTYEVFVGVMTWQRRVWDTINNFIQGRSQNMPLTCEEEKFQEYECSIYNFRNECLVKVTEQLSQRFLINSAISRLHGYLNNFKKIPVDVLVHSHQAELALADLIIMLSPMAPAFASELWTAMSSQATRTTDHKWDLGVLDQSWPLADLDYPLSLECCINENTLFHLKIPRKELEQLSEEEAIDRITSNRQFLPYIDRKPKPSGFTVNRGCNAVVTFSSSVVLKNKSKTFKKAKVKAKKEKLSTNQQ